MRSITMAGLLVLATAAAAFGQGPPAIGVPPIEQEPRPGVVRERETARGVAPSAGQNRAEQQEVDQLYRDLTGQNPNAPPPRHGPVLPYAGPPVAQEGRAVDQLYRDLTGQSPNAPAGPMPQYGPPLSQEGRAVDQLYRDLTGQPQNAPAGSGTR